MEVKIDKKGKVTIPKELRDRYGIADGAELVLQDRMEYDGPKIILRPKYFCSACGKALSDELAERGACLGCTPVSRETKVIY